MAVEIVRKLWDDLHLKEDGPDEKVEAIETLTFVYQGNTFEIDLSEEHLAGYHSYMERLANAARVPTPPKVSAKAAVAAAIKKHGAARGRNSPLSPYNTGMREYFKRVGRPIPSYTKKDQPTKTAGFAYRAHHYREYNEYLRQQGREQEIMVHV